MKIVSKVEITHTHTHTHTYISVPSFQEVKLAVQIYKGTEPTFMPQWHAVCNLLNTSVNIHRLGCKNRSVNMQGNNCCLLLQLYEKSTRSGRKT